MLMRSFWVKWNLVLSHRQHLFSVAKACRERMQLNLMRECWVEWRIQLTLQSKCKHIIDRNEQRITLIIFQSWFHDSFSAQMDRKALRFYKSKKSHYVWQIWSGHMALYQRDRTKAVQFFVERIQ